MITKFMDESENKAFITGRSIAVFLITGLLFFAVTMPFRHFFHVVSMTELRPASAFNPVLGLIFNWPAVLGCAFGNLVADIMSGYDTVSCILGFLVQVVYGSVPFLIWRRFGGDVRLNTAANVWRYMWIVSVDSAVTALLVSAVMHTAGNDADYLMTASMIFLNNFVFSMTIGIFIVLAFIRKTLSRKGETFSLNERLILIFLIMAVFSAVMMAWTAFGDYSGDDTERLYFVDRVYAHIAIDILLFCLISLFFVRYAERNITIPMEKLAEAAEDYISAGRSGEPDYKMVIERCGRYIGSYGEAGKLAEVFCDMSVNLEKYIDNLTKATAEKERIDTELNLAREIQVDMLPHNFPEFSMRSAFEIYASMDTAKEVGGDFYDFYIIDDSHIGITIADVADKGVPAALFMIMSKTYLKSRALTGETPGEILTNVNNQLCEGNDKQMFVTVWMAVLDLATGKLTAGNAGHEYPIISKNNKGFRLYKDRHDFVLGGMEDTEYKEYEMILSPGDVVFVYTDGVTEATDGKGEMYGTERLLQALNGSCAEAPEKIITDVRDDISRFVGEAVRYDDMTMLAMIYKGPGAESTIGHREAEPPPKAIEAGTLILEATMENWDAVMRFLECELQKAGCSARGKTSIEIAAEEIYTNIVKYAYPDDAGTVTISLSLHEGTGDGPGYVRIVFTDEGIPYDPLSREAPDITLPAEERTSGGLGIHMIRNMVDRVHYEYIDGHNVLTMENKTL